jgi:hypothetical protein
MARGGRGCTLTRCRGRSPRRRRTCGQAGNQGNESVQLYYLQPVQFPVFVRMFSSVLYICLWISHLLSVRVCLYHLATPKASTPSIPSALGLGHVVPHDSRSRSREFNPQDVCQQGRRARLSIDFSTGWACISHASDVLGMCVMITSALLRTETERWREEYNVSRPAGS